MNALNKTKTVGTFEAITFPDFPLSGKVMAKIDTGAYTGALHCTKIKEIKTDEGRRLQFAPFDHPSTIISLDKFVKRPVKSSNGKEENRYFIKTAIVLQGETYPITLSLADRSVMKWPVLIGRKFLRKNNFLVDVNKLT